MQHRWGLIGIYYGWHLVCAFTCELLALKADWSSMWAVRMFPHSGMLLEGDINCS